MNQVNPNDVTLMSLALADFMAAGVALNAHDYFVFGGLGALGIVLVYLYHHFGSPSNPSRTV